MALPQDNPEAINNHGDFVRFHGITTQAFIYADAVRTVLGTLGGPTSIAYGINNKGAIVGESTLPSGLPHAFVYYRSVMRDIGTLGGLRRSARDINNAGKIVGVAATGVGVDRHASSTTVAK